MPDEDIPTTDHLDALDSELSGLKERIHAGKHQVLGELIKIRGAHEHAATKHEKANGTLMAAIGKLYDGLEAVRQQVATLDGKLEAQSGLILALSKQITSLAEQIAPAEPFSGPMH